MKICSVEECKNKPHAKGLCWKHYDALPENKTKRAQRNTLPENKARKAQHDALPENKAKRVRRAALPKNKAQRAQYRRVNSEKVNVRNARHRVKKLNQTPVLTEEEQKRIDGNYELAKTLTKLTETQYDVDHIIPISKGGLHTPDNLRVITHEENMRKGAKLIGEY